jgi:hypothetical protein
MAPAGLGSGIYNDRAGYSVFCGAVIEWRATLAADVVPVIQGGAFAPAGGGLLPLQGVAASRRGNDCVQLAPEGA